MERKRKVDKRKVALMFFFFSIFVSCMKTKYITPAEYATYKGCKYQNITKHIRQGTIVKQPYIISVQHFSRFTLLEVPGNLTASTFERKKVRKAKA